MITPCTTHEPDGLLELVPEFWGKPRIAALLVGYLTQVQAFEDACWTLIDGIDVATAERYALEGLAQIVGEPARPANNDELRTLVRARIAANRSDGTRPIIETILNLLVPGETFRIRESGREVRVLQQTGTLPAPTAGVQVLDEACMAGRRAVWLECEDRLIRGVVPHGSLPRSKYYA